MNKIDIWPLTCWLRGTPHAVYNACRQVRNEVRWRPGKEGSLAPMFEPEVFRRQMNCIEESTCGSVGTFRRPHSDSATGEICPLTPLFTPCLSRNAMHIFRSRSVSLRPPWDHSLDVHRMRRQMTPCDAMAYAENFHRGGHFNLYLVCAVCDVTLWRHIHVSKPTFSRNLLTQYVYCFIRTRLILCAIVLNINYQRSRLRYRRKTNSMLRHSNL